MFGGRFIGLGPPVSDIIAVEDGDEALGAIRVVDLVHGRYEACRPEPSSPWRGQNESDGPEDSREGRGRIPGGKAAEIGLSGSGELHDPADIKGLALEVLEALWQGRKIVVGDGRMPGAVQRRIVETVEFQVNGFRFGGARRGSARSTCPDQTRAPCRCRRSGQRAWRCQIAGSSLPGEA